MRTRLPWAVLLAVVVLTGPVGCFHAPVVPDAIPVRRLPDEVVRHPADCAGACPVVVGAPIAPVAGEKGKGVVPAKSDVPPAPGVADVPPLPAAGCGSCAVFYTGGLLPPGEHPLTRDLRVVEAIAVARGPIRPGSGFLSPTRVTVLRRLSSGQQVPIRVDLTEALRDPRENIPVWPGDLILLHERTGETTCRWAGQMLLLSPRLAFRAATGYPVP